LIYFAANFNWHSETKGTWTAISRAPYLKAISIWSKGDTYFGGGLFLDNKTALLHGHHDKALRLSDELRIVEDQRGWSAGRAPLGPVAPSGAERVQTLGTFLTPQENAIYEASLRQRFGSYRAFASYRAGWRLNQEGEETMQNWGHGRNITRNWWLRRPTARTGYQLIQRRTEFAIDLPNGTSWADADNWGADAERPPATSRVLWVLDGMLFAAKLTPKGMGEPTLLFDFNPMTYEPVSAPY
jgi:hypothetical protein